jgi:hypothetical protein
LTTTLFSYRANVIYFMLSFLTLVCTQLLLACIVASLYTVFNEYQTNNRRKEVENCFGG